MTSGWPAGIVAPALSAMAHILGHTPTSTNKEKTTMDWRKSSFCSAESSTTEQCVEVAETDGGRILVRDSTGRVAGYTRDEFSVFVAGVKAGEFDDLT